MCFKVYSLIKPMLGSLGMPAILQHLRIQIAYGWSYQHTERLPPKSWYSLYRVKPGNHGRRFHTLRRREVVLFSSFPHVLEARTPMELTAILEQMEYEFDL